MEVLEGPSLAAAVGRRGPMPPRSVLMLAAGLAEALSAAHAAGLIHPGLRPDTVLLTARGPRLTDPGVARAAYRGLAPHLGTPPGMADFTPPERAAGLDAGPASDMFGLGLVLLYAATGAWMSHFAWHLDQLPGELRPVIERCMAADPARRPTAAQLCTELASSRPESVNFAATPPAAGPLSTGGWPAPSGIPASAGTPGLAPFGPPAPVPLYPAQTIASRAPKTRKPRDKRRIRRLTGISAIAALAVAVAMAGAVYVIHPWPYPVLRPTGLTADQQAATSISLSWSGPASGPSPDKYVILRDGALAATVPGNVNHYEDGGLTPATAYDFRVVAYRGSVGSQPSPDLRAATRTPPVSAGVFDSAFAATEKITAGGDEVQGDSNGQTWQDAWTFTSNCAVGPCTTVLSGTIDQDSFTATLKAGSRGTYFGTAPVDNAYYCGSNQSNTTHSEVVITISPKAATLEGTQWQASHFSGTVSWQIAANPNGGCAGATLVMNVTG